MHIFRSMTLMRPNGSVALWLLIGAGVLVSVGCSTERKTLNLGPIPQDLLDRYGHTGKVAFANTARPIRIRKNDGILPSSKRRVPLAGVTHGKIVNVPVGNLVSEAIRRAAEQLVDEVKYDADPEACTIDFFTNKMKWCANEKKDDEVCELECTIRFLDHEGREVYLRKNRFCAEHASTFDGENVPRSIWECAIDIACTAVDEMSQEKGVLQALQR